MVFPVRSRSIGFGACRVRGVAVGFWEGRPVIVSRWNGTDERPVGMPQSRGLPIWYVHEDASYPWLVPYLDSIAPESSQFLRGFLALKDAA
jgi:hypothetical protein